MTNEKDEYRWKGNKKKKRKKKCYEISKVKKNYFEGIEGKK